MKRLPFFIAALFILPMVFHSPAGFVENSPLQTSGKSTSADIAITDLNITTPSVYSDGNPTLAPLNHTIRVVILNQGGDSADGDLKLRVNGAQVDNRSISINPAQQETHIMYWNATSVGSGPFTLSASWVVGLSSTDSDSSNDMQSLIGVTVTSLEQASLIADTLPDSNSNLSRAPWSGAITLMNTGNEPVDVTASLRLQSTAPSADVVVLSSTTASLVPGSLSNSPVPQNITVGFDGSNLEGEYRLTGSVTVTNADGVETDAIAISQRTVSFITLRATLIPSNNMNLDPGASALLNFILQNSGDEEDSFSVTQSNTSDPGEYWVDSPSTIHSPTEPLDVAPGSTSAIQIPLEVPADADLGDFVIVTVTVQSIEGGYILTASTVIIAGAFFNSSLEQNHSHADGPNFANVTPGTPRTIDYTLKNTGTAPTQFQIFSSPTESVPFWEIYSPVTITDLVMPNETRTIPVTITTPELEMPINPSWRISSGTRVQVGVQAIPIEGGLPSVNYTTIVVDPVVELDMKFSDGDFGEISDSKKLSNVSADEILASNVKRIVDFQIRLEHNLGSGNTTAAQVIISPIGSACSPRCTGISFLPDISGQEKTRWRATLDPGTMELTPGETEYGSLILTHHPLSTSFPYPAAGNLSFSFEATSPWASFDNTTISKNDQESVYFWIDKIVDAELSSGPIATGNPNEQITGSVFLKNTGNDAEDFTLNYIGLPGWTIDLTPGAISQVKSRTNLFPKVPCSTTEIIPNCDDQDKKTITVKATPPSFASADTTHEIWVYINKTVNGVDTGEQLTYAAAYFQLNEQISAELIPENSTAVIKRQGSTTILLQLNNSGNSNKTFDLDLLNLNGQGTDCDRSITSPNDPLFQTLGCRIQISFSEDSSVVELARKQTVPPGAQAIVRVYTWAGLGARADEDSRFEVSVSNDGEELDRSGIIVKVDPDHNLTFLMNKEFFASPGGSIVIDAIIQNNGNLMETFNVSAEIPDGWNQTVNKTSAMSLEPGASQEEHVRIIITLPPLDESTVLAADEVHVIDVHAWNVSDGDSCISNDADNDGDGDDDFPCPGSEVITVTILPVFSLQVLESPSRIAVLPGAETQVEYTIRNSGNAPMSIGFGWDLEDAAGLGESARFGVQLQSGANSNPFNLALRGEEGDTTTITVTVSPLADDLFRLESAMLSIVFTPIGVDLDEIIIPAPIQVVRVQTDEEIVLNADGGTRDSPRDFDCGPPDVDQSTGGCIEIPIPWVHVPSIGFTDASLTSYNLSLQGNAIPERKLPGYSAWQETEWSISIDDKCVLESMIDNPGVTDASLEEDTCYGGWDVGSVTTYEGGTIFLRVAIPMKEKLAPLDGWDIGLRLKNPNEPDTPQYWTDFTVKLRMTESSDPLVKSIEFNGSSIEGDETTIDVLVINAGNAVMPTGTILNLQCAGSFGRITSVPDISVPSLNASGTFTGTWNVVLDPIPWFKTSEPYHCTATLILPTTIGGNNLDNDGLNNTLQIQSWSPPSPALEISGFTIPIPLVALFGLLVIYGALILLRNGLEESPNQLHISGYVAGIGFGLVSITNVTSWSIWLGAIATIIFAGVVAWLSTSELQTIHDDRKKARIGTRSVLEDHDQEQANTRKELRAIISCAPYSFLPFVLLNSALAIDFSGSGILMLGTFFVGSPILVHLILTFIDASYDRLYGDLADIELRAIKIKKILGSVGKKSGGN